VLFRRKQQKPPGASEQANPNHIAPGMHSLKAPSINHGNYRGFLSQHFNKQGMRILEVGSREVTGKSDAQTLFTQADYVGFDYYDGNNVDVVGDAHQLSSYFEPGEQFDFIYSLSCFEHFAMPWIVSVEMAKMLKVGGHLFIETHFSYASHERPWHFFQFSDMALRTLFSPALGFECLDAGLYNPMDGRFSEKADAYLRGKPIPDLYCHVDFYARKVKDVPNFKWEDVSLSEVVSGTEYPAPKP
jgi:SAM-dependent methyltransferase